MGYEQLPATGERFEEQTVAVFGYGNAAFETVDAISPYANYVHMFGGRTNSERFAKDAHQFVSWESRYVGDLRALNAGTLDAYTLKSLDGIGLGELNGLKMVKCGPNATKVCFFLKGEPAIWKGNPDEPGKKVETITLGAFSHKHDPWAREFVASLGSARVNTEADKARAGKGRSSGDIHCQIAGATGQDGKPAMVNGELRSDVETLTGTQCSAKCIACPSCIGIERICILVSGASLLGRCLGICALCIFASFLLRLPFIPSVLLQYFYPSI